MLCRIKDNHWVELSPNAQCEIEQIEHLIDHVYSQGETLLAIEVRREALDAVRRSPAPTLAIAS